MVKKGEASGRGKEQVLKGKAEQEQVKNGEVFGRGRTDMKRGRGRCLEAIRERKKEKKVAGEKKTTVSKGGKGFYQIMKNIL